MAYKNQILLIAIVLVVAIRAPPPNPATPAVTSCYAGYFLNAAGVC
jgi:hypothetical protein